MKKITDLKLADWQELVNQFIVEKNPQTNAPIAMRIDGTQLSVMSFYGGGTYYGVHYTTFEDKSVAGEFTCEFATIAVRQDFLKWVSDKIRVENKKAGEVK